MNTKIASRLPRIQQTVLQFEDFINPFGARLRTDNKWVVRAGLIPWDVLEIIHNSENSNQNLDSNLGGRPEVPFRMAFGALLVKEILGCTDRETVEMISENPYIQFFLGMPNFSIEPPFHATSMVDFRKRFGDAMIRKANEALLEIRQDEPLASKDQESIPQNKGTMIIDASCVPEDMRYPTDLGLLNDVRTFTEAFVTYLWHSSSLSRKDGEKIPRTYRREARREFLNVVRKRKLKENELRRGIRKQLGYCLRNFRHIQSMLGRMDERFSLNEKHVQRLELAKRIVAQQASLLDLKIGKNGKRASIPDRIVSFFKPHVRPIVRGKAAHPTEFGAKISIAVADGFVYLDRLSWNAYHEGADLPIQANAYKVRTGFWPARVLCDKAYHSRENRAWCKERGIILGAPPVGRPPKDEGERKAMAQEVRRNEIDRIEVEGKFGVAKRRFSLGRVMTRLRESSECVISLVFMVMNLEKLARLLFVLSVFMRNIAQNTDFLHLRSVNMAPPHQLQAA
jgi:transposase, IS5 family